jgi:hypothetical protein
MKDNKHIQSFGEFNENFNDVQNPKFTDKNAEDFLIRLGIDITKATGEYKPGVPEEPNCGIRMWPSKTGVTKILYSFKIKEDRDKFESYLNSKNIQFERPHHGDAVGARYPYQVIINKKSDNISESVKDIIRRIEDC